MINVVELYKKMDYNDYTQFNLIKLIIKDPIKYKKFVDNFCLLCPINKRARAIYGSYFNLPLVCNDHNFDKLPDVTNKSCLFKGLDNKQCTESAIWGRVYREPIYCRNHKIDNMIDVISRIQENDVISYVMKLEFIKDRKIYNNLSLSNIFEKKIKSKYRPDLLIKGNDNIIIVEIDENQHKNYKFDKEIERENTIRLLIKTIIKTNIVFIRFNPSVFYDKDEKIILFSQIHRFKLLERILLDIKDIKEDKRILLCYDKSEDNGYVS